MSSQVAPLVVVRLCCVVGDDKGQTHSLQDLDFAKDALHLCIVLALQLVQNRVAILAPAVWRRRPKALATVGVEAAIARRRPVTPVSIPATRARTDGSPGPVPRVAVEERTARVALVQRRRAEPVDRRGG